MRAGITLVALPTLALFAVTQTNILRPLLTSRLRAMLGCDATAASVHVEFSGDIRVRGLVLRAPGLAGPAGVILDAPDVVLRPDWGALARGRATLREVVVRRPVLRLSQDDSMALNIDRLRPAGAGGAIGAVPSVDIEYATVEFGEHGDGWFTSLISTEVVGSLSRRSGPDAQFAVSLTETDAGAAAARTAPGTPAPHKLAIVGELDLTGRTAELRLSDVDLRRFRGKQVPSRIQEVWRRLGLDGAVRETVFTWSAEAGAAVVFTLDDVALAVPLPAPPDGPPSPDPDSDLLPMRRVRGSVRFDETGMAADLAGEIGEFTGSVRLQTRGYTARSGLECTIRIDEFVMGESPRFLPYSPRWVARNFIRFSGPTAQVTGEVALTRADPGPDGPRPLVVRGRVEFTEGAAEYELFRYPFRDMTGLILFDETEVRLVSITGAGPTGASLLATGRIAPPADGALVDLEITATSVPFDEHLLAAVPSSRRGLLDAMFSRDEFERLERAGLFLPRGRREALALRRMDVLRALAEPNPGGAAALRAELTEIDRRLALPAFDLGGPSRVRVVIHRDLGHDADFTTTIDVAMTNAGLLPELVPFPMLADGLSLVVDRTEARVQVPSARGLTGCAAALDATIGFEADAPHYSITANATAVPIDPTLIAALPDDPGPPGPSGAPAPSARALVTALGLRGVADITATAHREHAQPGAYSVQAELSNLTVQPPGSLLAITDGSATLRVTESLVALDEFKGDAHGAPVTGSMRAEGERRAVARLATHAQATFEGLDLSRPIEDLVGAFVPATAESLAALRAERTPQGVVDLAVRYDDDGSDQRTEARLTRPRGVSFGLLASRVIIDDATGAVVFADGEVECQALDALISFEGFPAGRLSLDGRWPLSAGAGDMRVALAGGRFESPAVRALARRADRRLAEFLTSLNARGGFDAAGHAIVEPGGGANPRSRARSARRRSRSTGAGATSSPHGWRAPSPSTGNGARSAPFAPRATAGPSAPKDPGPLPPPSAPSLSPNSTPRACIPICAPCCPNAPTGRSPKPASRSKGPLRSRGARSYSRPTPSA
ncbi:MAG TPA: hypothetical protein DEB06_03905 [Phycisphaerales bacterium]|nr:hypothetical protein [Phycisphaerales bacterium]